MKILKKFKHTVDIPISKYSDSKNRYSYCLENIGPEYSTWYTQIVAEFDRNNPLWCKYYFDTDEDAIMFKLKFG